MCLTTECDDETGCRDKNIFFITLTARESDEMTLWVLSGGRRQRVERGRLAVRGKRQLVGGKRQLAGR